MLIELPVRWTERSKDPDAIEKRNVDRLVNGEESEIDDPALIKYTYSYIVIDTEDIRSFYPLSEHLTIIMCHNVEGGLITTLSYELFKDVYQEVTHNMIKTIQLIPQELLDEMEEDEKDPEDEEPTNLL